MTSEERKAGRRARREAARLARTAERNQISGGAEAVFSFRSLYLAGKRCCKGVGWKASTQRFRGGLIRNAAVAAEQVRNGTYRSKGFHRFSIHERGKERDINSLHIQDRMVQWCLCERALIPLYRPCLIHDNSANLRGKGLDFAIGRVKKFLREYYRENGNEGYVLLYDFRRYYEMAEHRVLLQESMRRILSQKVRDAADQAVKDFGERGLGLGSPVSQINALILANGVDHWAKERAGIRWYHRYADDGIAIAKDRRTLELAVAGLKNVCAARGITLNEKKTKILPLSRGFRYLKLKFTLDEKGRVHTKIPRRPTKVLRKKLRCFLRWIREGSATMEDLRCVYGSYRGYLARGEHYRTDRRTAAYFQKLYGFWPETKGEWERYVSICNGGRRDRHSDRAGVGAEAGERLPEPV